MCRRRASGSGPECWRSAGTTARPATGDKQICGRGSRCPAACSKHCPRLWRSGRRPAAAPGTVGVTPPRTPATGRRACGSAAMARSATGSLRRRAAPAAWPLDRSLATGRRRPVRSLTSRRSDPARPRRRLRYSCSDDAAVGIGAPNQNEDDCLAYGRMGCAFTRWSAGPIARSATIWARSFHRRPGFHSRPTTKANLRGNEGNSDATTTFVLAQRDPPEPS
jgi:hypothetical protein